MTLSTTILRRCALLGALCLATTGVAREQGAPPASNGDATVAPRAAAIASASAYATDAGLEVLAAGGNAFDAAVAVSATLGLTEPESSGIGGGGFFLLHLAKDGRDVFVDARERAPLAATRDMYLDAQGKAQRENSVNGPLAAGIPGLPAGLVHVAERYGRLPLAASLAPAIRLAREGWRFGPKNVALLGARKEVIQRYPGARDLFMVRTREMLVDEHGNRTDELGFAMPEVGTRMVNLDYAATLERIANEGHAGFYRGELAQRLVDGVRAAGGLWTMEDMTSYRVVEREPLRFTHRGFTLVTAPPPSSGGIALAEILNVMSGYDYPALDVVPRTHLLVEAMRRAYRDRADYLGDPDFVQTPIAMLSSPDYAAGLRAGINLDRATPSALLAGIGSPPERPETTHFSIVDTEGNLAAVTQTVNLPYGNAFAVEGTGFLLNNEMDDFSVAPGVPNAFGLVGDEANAIEPGKRPLSSMTPTFLLGKDTVAAIGTPGGSRIITMVLLGLLELMDGRSAQAAADRPRFHHQYLPDAISAEPDAFTPEQVDVLRALGHTVSAGESTWGNMQVVVWNRRTGAVDAGSDRRGKGVGKAATSAETAIYH